jgi:hypothetical protein
LAIEGENDLVGNSRRLLEGNSFSLGFSGTPVDHHGESFFFLPAHKDEKPRQLARSVREEWLAISVEFPFMDPKNQISGPIKCASYYYGSVLGGQLPCLGVTEFASHRSLTFSVFFFPTGGWSIC